ncbi:RecT-like ssDNA binding protein [Tsukamurella ocularis]|uniref:hypothetical protein n=1 Tax=Tsukamurella ocularis TaxID=1970234 RepID=UPI0039EE2B11
MSIDLATIDTPDARALAVNAERARMMQLADQALPRQYRGNPAALLVAFEYADSLGIPRIAALTGVHIVDGKPTASADLIGALVRKAGHTLRVQGDETYATALIIRADDPEFIPEPIRWDMARARNAGLTGKDVWRKYPGAMLRSRAITEAARMWASEALFGVVYTPEELGAPVDDSGSPIIDGEVVPPTQRPAERPASESTAPTDEHNEAPASSRAKPLVTQEQLDTTLRLIAEAQTQDDLDAVLKTAAGLDFAEHAADLRAIWNARAEELAKPQDNEGVVDVETVEPEQATIDAETEAAPA